MTYREIRPAVSRCYRLGCDTPYKEVLLSVNRLRNPDSDAYKKLDLPPIDKWDIVGSHEVPKKGGVYVMLLDGIVMYIGSSKTLKQRLTGHPILKDVRKMGGNVSVRFFETPHYLFHEAALISKHTPPLNTNHNPVNTHNRRIHNHKLIHNG